MAEEELEELTIESLPEKIRDWISSNQVTLTIKDINRRLGIAGGRQIIIPALVHDIVTYYLDPAELSNELGEELGMNQTTAKKLAQEIEEKILRPIGRDLLNEMNIDIKDIYYGKPKETPKEEPPKEKTPAEKIEEEVRSEEGLRRITAQTDQSRKDSTAADAASPRGERQIPKPQETPRPEQQVEKGARVNLEKLEQINTDRRADQRSISASGSAPFILHQHKEEEYAKPTTMDAGPKMRITPPPAKEEKREKPVSVRVEGYKEAEIEPLPTMPAPAEEEVEITKEKESGRETSEKDRVINYSLPKTTQIINRGADKYADPKESADIHAEREGVRPEQQMGAETDQRNVPRFVDSDKSSDSSDRSNNNMRVVHYHDLRTPLTSIGTPKPKSDDQNVLDLRNNKR